MAGGALWLAAVCALCACDVACGGYVYWPGCDATLSTVDFSLIRTDEQIRVLGLYNCAVTTINLQNMARYLDATGLWIESKVMNIIAPKFDCDLTLISIKARMSWKNLPLDWIQTCKALYYLIYSHVNISDAPDNFIRRTKSLNALQLTDSSLNRIPPFFINNVFSNLTHFVVNDNEISDISDPATFANAVFLTFLSLSYNKIEFLNADVFKPLRYIQIIDLMNNRLKYVPEALFQNKQDLTKVDLSHNLIESVAFNAFAGTSIKTVHLHNNRLTQLPVNFISNLHSIAGLQEFSFHGNRWDCVCLNKILITMKQLGVDYGKDNFDGKHQECFINMPGLVVQPNLCT